MWAAVFPGQGSQHIGMGQFLYNDFKEARTLFEEASDTLHLNFKKLCFEGSESDLSLTENTQPALILVSTVYYRVLSQLNELPLIATSGHSVGEYAALVAAGALKFSDALRAVRERGKLMQSAVPVGQGSMAAVMGLNPEQVKALCSWAQTQSTLGVLEPANFNAPGQIVISGSSSVLKWLQDHYSEQAFPGAPKRLKLIPLKVSAPFHCSLMKPAEEKMGIFLNNTPFSKAHSPVVQNVTAKPHQESEDLRNNLIQQISAPVRWVECVETLKSLGAFKFIEMGSGKVLSGLVKKIDSEALKTFNINSLEELKDLEQELQGH